MLVASMTEQEEAVCRRLGDGGAGGLVLAIAREVARMHLRVGDGARFRVLSARLGALQVRQECMQSLCSCTPKRKRIDANLHTCAYGTAQDENVFVRKRMGDALYAPPALAQASTRLLLHASELHVAGHHFICPPEF